MRLRQGAENRRRRRVQGVRASSIQVALLLLGLVLAAEAFGVSSRRGQAIFRVAKCAYYNVHRALSKRAARRAARGSGPDAWSRYLVRNLRSWTSPAATRVESAYSQEPDLIGPS